MSAPQSNNMHSYVLCSSKDLDLRKTLFSGQAFRWLATNHSYRCTVEGRKVTLLEFVDEIVAVGPEEDREFWRDYFDLNREYPKAWTELEESNDVFGLRAIKAGKGLRVMRQPLREVCIAFLLSQNNNVGRIRKTMLQLCQEQGDVPSWNDLAEIDIGSWQEMGAGYRAGYLAEFAQKVAENPECLEKLSELPDEKLLEALCQFRGIGIKVASCIALFGYSRTSLIPEDVWIKRIKEERYKGEHLPYTGTEWAGLFQQLVYDYVRQNPKELDRV